MRARASLPCSILAVSVLAAIWSAGAAGATPVPRSQELAVFVQGQTAMAKPDERSARRAWIERIRPITEGRTVLPVIGHRTGADGTRWLRVRLPGRPNNGTGWIRKARTRQSATTWHLVVDLSERRLQVFRQGRPVRSFPAVIGAPATPTPRGAHFVEESVLLSGGQVGGPFALALSARSYILQEFAGGPGQTAVHGVWNVGGTMGSAVSKGCLRLDTASITWLGRRIGPGVPVTVVA